MLPLHALCNDVRPSHRSLHHDSNLAPPRRQHHRRICLRWYPSLSSPQSSTCSLDSNHLLHPLGHRCPSSNVHPLHLLPAPHDPQAPSARGDSLRLPTTWSPWPRWLRHHAIGKSGFDALPYQWNAAIWVD
jgi:hypothetical protein